MKSLINNAIKNKKVLFLKYKDIKKAYTERNIEPIYIHQIEEEGVNNMILEAFCRLRQNRRYFRLDRVLEISQTNNYFYTNYSPTNTANIFDEISSFFLIFIGFSEITNTLLLNEICEELIQPLICSGISTSYQSPFFLISLIGRPFFL